MSAESDGQVEALARLLCKADGGDPDDVVLPSPHAIGLTSRGDLVMTGVPDRFLIGWMRYAHMARHAVRSGWSKEA